MWSCGVSNAGSRCIQRKCQGCAWQIGGRCQGAVSLELRQLGVGRRSDHGGEGTPDYTGPGRPSKDFGFTPNDVESLWKCFCRGVTDLASLTRLGTHQMWGNYLFLKFHILSETTLPLFLTLKIITRMANICSVG